MHERIMEAGRYLFRVEENIRRAESLALEVLRLAGNKLLVELRFLDAALVRFIPSGSGSVTASLATDGSKMYFNPAHILRGYQASPARAARDYIHVTPHCLFHHLFISQKLNMELGDLACDIAVENTINGLGLKALACRRQEAQKEFLVRLRQEVSPLTAEKIYRCLLRRRASARPQSWNRSPRSLTSDWYPIPGPIIPGRSRWSCPSSSRRNSTAANIRRRNIP